MKCYLCKLQGKDTDAVASCIVCGMGVCIDHVVREEVDLWEGGHPFPSKKLKNKIPRMLCIPCHEAYKEGKK
jgi:hypothetical protein